MRANGPQRYLANCFWFVVPVLLFNWLFARDLPAMYQANVYWKDIPPGIGVPENVLRGLVALLPALTPVTGDRARRKTGLVLYAVGLGLYFSSWAALIARPESAWARSAPGFLAPSWTPALWLMGIALLGDEGLFVVSSRFYGRWQFASLSAAFLAFHNAHAALVFARR
jgi:hypothetical protein